MPDLTIYEYDIFLSHNRTDEAWTTKLAERLEREDWQGRKLKVFFSPWDIRPGQLIPSEIERALPKSRKVGLVMSPDAMTSVWVALERLVMTYISVSAQQERLLPLYRRDCDIPALIQHIVYIDFRDDTQFETNYQTLLTIIKDEPLPRGGREQTNTTSPLLPVIPRPPVVGFIARRDEQGRDILARLQAELAPGREQLVALWGPGGTGKTTLAAETVRALRQQFPQRVAWVSALGRTEFALATLLDEIASQFGRADLRSFALEQKEAQVRAVLADAPALVVLDNFETVAPEEQARCLDFLAGCAACSALVTTRGDTKHGDVGNVALAAMAQDEAREFLRRLIEQTRQPQDFAGLDADDLIGKCEANPLVLQWVVKQIELARQPQTALDYLAQGKSDAAERVFDRSFKLPQVGDDGRAVLLALTLFVPSATRAALAEVAGLDTDLPRLERAVENLSALWLVETTAGNERLILRGLTRALAKARLGQDTHADGYRRRFVAYFLRYAMAHRPKTPQDYDALEVERDNLLSAVDTASVQKDWASVMRLAYPMNKMLSVRGYWDETLRSGVLALQAARAAEAEAQVANLSHNLAVIYQTRGELVEARRLYDESLEIAKKLDNQSGIAMTLHELGRLAQKHGELGEARRRYNESLEIKKKLGNQDGIAMTLHELGRLAQAQREPVEARRLYDESLEIAKKLGNQSSIAMTLHELGRLAQKQGQLGEARRLYDESLEIEKKLCDQSATAMTLHELGRLAQKHGELGEARRRYNESLEIAKKLGNQSGIAATLHELGRLAQKQGELVEARRLYDESLEIVKKLGNQSSIAMTLHELGRLAQKQGQLGEARRLYDESLEIKRRLGDQSGIGMTLHNLAALAQDQGELGEARRLYDKSLEIAKKLGDQDGIAMTTHQLGLLAEAEGDRAEVARLLRDALSIFERLKSPYAEMARENLARLESEDAGSE
jgi:tetratricopeptide (TPR) repeat protein